MDQANNVIDYIDDLSNVVQQDAQISSQPDLRSHVELITAALKLVQVSVLACPHQTVEELVILRLAIRCFNSGAASLRLIRGGYWQPAGLVARDVMETMFLLDLLTSDPTEAKRWHSLSEKDREAEFKPVTVRGKLDARDGNKKQKRRQAYKSLSRLCSHATPEGFAVISPRDNTIVGPFADNARLKALIEELVKPMAYVGDIVYHSIDRQTDQATAARIMFRTVADQWRTQWLNAKL